MRVVLSLGANLGDPRAQLAAALRALEADPLIRVVAVSGAFETAPLGRLDQPPFVNLAAVIQTELTPVDLLGRTQRIEDDLGRARVERWGPRTLDIDLIVADAPPQQDAVLTLPHPRAQERAFVLAPWLELDAGAELPGHGRVADLLAALPDQDIRRTGPLEA